MVVDDFSPEKCSHGIQVVLDFQIDGWKVNRLPVATIASTDSRASRCSVRRSEPLAIDGVSPLRLTRSFALLVPSAVMTGSDVKIPHLDRDHRIESALIAALRDPNALLHLETALVQFRPVGQISRVRSPYNRQSANFGREGKGSAEINAKRIVLFRLADRFWMIRYRDRS
jgi:hypothetical protein